jgi:pimeloyl-ACP methyl ester carboxylesterase
MLAYIYDLKQLIDQMDLAPVTIIAHSMGGNIAIRYAGLYPEKVKKLVAIEGLGPSPKVQAEFEAQGVANRLRGWMETKQKYADIAPRRYKDFDAALTRMKTENPHLSSDQVRHLTVHAVVRNEDGSYSWKFDPLMRNWWPHDLPAKATQDMWRAITCPTLMLYGADSWASNPVTDGRIAHFGDNVEVREFEKAGHWLHHDQFDLFMETLNGFL